MSRTTDRSRPRLRCRECGNPINGQPEHGLCCACQTAHRCHICEETYPGRLPGRECQWCKEWVLMCEALKSNYAAKLLPAWQLELRIDYYIQRAAKELPLFEGIERFSS